MLPHIKGREPAFFLVFWTLLHRERSYSDPMSLRGGEGSEGGGGDGGGVGGSQRASPPSARPPVDVNFSSSPSSVAGSSSNLGRVKKGRLGNRDSSSLPPESIEELSRPARPGYGTEGHKYFVAANHFLAVVDDKTIFRYHVRVFGSSFGSNCYTCRY